MSRPCAISNNVVDVYHTEQTAYASLEALNSEDIDLIAGHSGLDVAAFRKALHRSGARAGGDLPARRLELFDRGLQLLATDRVERREEGTAIDIPVADLLDAAERLACLSLLSGRETVDYSDGAVRHVSERP
jgi:hypothetical protein